MGQEHCLGFAFCSDTIDEGDKRKEVEMGVDVMSKDLVGKDVMEASGAAEYNIERGSKTHR